MTVQVIGPADASPRRRPESVRRTTTIDMVWPGGWGTDLALRGHGRDLLTGPTGNATVLDTRRMSATVGTDRSLRELLTDPVQPELSSLVGQGCGSGFRARLSGVVPEAGGLGPLYLLLDDLPGATLISGFAAAHWLGPEQLAVIAPEPSVPRVMTGVCTGFQPGSSGLAPDGTSRWTHRTRSVEPLEGAEDELAWHEIRPETGMSMRRARRMDVWVAEGVAMVDAMFQDTSTTRSGGRIAVHEYTLRATADLGLMTLTSVHPIPQVLPYAECPLAVVNTPSLVGTPLADLRTVVAEQLSGVSGCTHLNDALRALADVPHLISLVPRK